MKRICLIGDSHVAALKLGWDQIRGECPQARLTFFGSAGDTCERIKLKGRSLVPVADLVKENFKRTSGGLESIELKHFDCFVLVALGFGPASALDVAAEFSWCDTRLDQRKRLVSRECFEQAVTDALRHSLAVRTGLKIRPAVSKPVYILAQPGRSLAYMERETFRQAHAAAPAGAWELLGGLWTECAAKVAAETGIGVLHQPGDTLRNHLFTDPRYTDGAVRLKGDLQTKQPELNTAHMNAAYGATTLKTVLSRL